MPGDHAGGTASYMAASDLADLASPRREIMEVARREVLRRVRPRQSGIATPDPSSRRGDLPGASAIAIRARVRGRTCGTLGP